MRVSFDGKMFSTLFHSLHPLPSREPTSFEVEICLGISQEAFNEGLPHPQRGFRSRLSGCEWVFYSSAPASGCNACVWKMLSFPCFMPWLFENGGNFLVRFFFFCYLSPSSYHFRRRLVELCTWAVECCENCLNNTVHAPIDATFILREYFIYHEKDSHLK